MPRRSRRTRRRDRYYQIGKSVTHVDKRYRAKRPGPRISASGRRYYERRRNRSDRDRRKRL